jgi:phosphotransferase system enzyme I (PtsI)
MEAKKGIPVSPGVCIGKVELIGQEEFRVPLRIVRRDRIENEVERLKSALSKTNAELSEEVSRLGEGLSVARQVLESHRAIVADSQLESEVVHLVRTKKYAAEYALVEVMRAYCEKFEAMDSRYISDRAHDLQDIERKVLGLLLGKKKRRKTRQAAGSIVVGHRITPSQAAALDRSTIQGFAIDVGGRTSHIAIMARAMQMPAVVGLEDLADQVTTGDTIIIDGYTGMVITKPDKETLEEYRWKTSVSKDFYIRLQGEVRLPAETLDGCRVSIAANIEFPDEIHSALEWGACGVGLYRTEFLYDETHPDEEKHYRNYRAAVDELQGRYLVVRTLDAGADKFHSEAVGRPEPNPFLGCRSIRLCFEYPEVFRAQIRAVLRVSSIGPVRIMLPMISALEELRAAKDLIREFQDELEGEGVDFDRNIPLGVMVEVPSAALLADRLSREVDFFSIGTNDLVQYCLAVDRINERVAHLYQPTHPAILGLVSDVIEAGRSQALDVSICGEMCSEPLYTILILGLGLRTFSVSPIAIPTVKRIIRKVTMRDAESVARTCMAYETAAEGHTYLESQVKNMLPELF